MHAQKVCDVVQRDADILLWSRDLTLEELETADGLAEKNKKRIRRWVAKDRQSVPGAKEE